MRFGGGSEAIPMVLAFAFVLLMVASLRSAYSLTTYANQPSDGANKASNSQGQLTVSPTASTGEASRQSESSGEVMPVSGQQIGSADSTLRPFNQTASEVGGFLHDFSSGTTGPALGLGLGNQNVTTQPPPSSQQQMGSGESVSTTTGFKGLNYGYNGPLGNNFSPPDVQVAAGPSDVVEMVNVLGEVFTKQGSSVSTFSLASFFGTGGDYITDPKVLYDGGSGRWFATLEDGTTDSIHLAISATSDPTSNWYFYTISETHSYCPDQPILGISSDKVAISVNDYSSCNSETSSTFTGAEYWILEKSALLSGSTVSFQYFGPNTSLFSVHPVQSLSTTDTLYMVSTWAGGTSLIRVFIVTGVPPGTVNVQDSDISITPTSVVANAAQPGTPNLVDVNDNRVLDAKLYGQEVWLDFNDGCIPAGDIQQRTCARYVEINVGTDSIVQDFSVGDPGYYYYYPALSVDTSGNMLTMFGYSSSSTYPSITVSGQGTFDPPDSIETLQAAAQGTGFESTYCPTSGVCRYGDYFGAATDPANGNMVWLAGEIGTGSGWSTFIEEISLPSPGVATTVNLAPVGSSAPVSSSNEFAVSYTLGGVNKTTYDAGQPITVAADSGTYVWFSAESSASTSSERWVFDSQAPEVGILAGSSSTLYYYDLLSEPAYYAVAYGGSPPSPSFTYYTAPPALPTQPTIQENVQTLLQSSQSVWALRGTTISVAGAVPGAQNEQWAPQTSSWYVSQPNEVPSPITYYHQYQVSFGFVVNDGGAGYSPPTVGYSSAGMPQVTDVGAAIWADASSYSFPNELPGSSSSERWEVGPDGTGSVSSPGTITSTYYHQFELLLSYQIVGGGTPGEPQITTAYLGQTSSYILSGLSPGVQSALWIDAGSPYQFSSLTSGSTQTERWYGDTAPGTANGYSTLTTTYYHQFYVEVDYSIVGGGTPTAPTLIYQYLGSPTPYQMAQLPSFMWIDDNHWSTASTLGGSSATERWTAQSGTNGTLTSDSAISPRYFHQFAFISSFSISDGSSAPGPTLVSTQYGSPASQQLGEQPTTHWLDNGATWKVNGILMGSNSTERWAALATTNGVISGTRTLSFEFFHQFYLIFRTKQVQGGVVNPTSWYNATSSIQLSALPSQGWQFEYWNGTGRGAYTGLDNSFGLTILGPIAENATFYPGLTIVNGGNGQVEYSWGSRPSATVSGTITAYVPVGTNVTLSESPSSSLFVFNGYTGAVNTTKRTASTVVQAPAIVSARFAPNYPVIAGIAGGVALAAAAVYLFGLRRPKPTGRVANLS